MIRFRCWSKYSRFRSVPKGVMRFRFALTAVFSTVLCAAAPASAQSLIEQPSATDVALAYPEGALANGVDGAATVACVIGATGYLEQCEVAAENPAGYGFGAAALTVMRHFRYAATTQAGARSEGVRKRLTVRFSFPANSSEPASRDPQP
jgi:TonB family protein